MIWRDRDFFSMVVDHATFHFMLPRVANFYQALRAQQSHGIGGARRASGSFGKRHVAVLRQLLCDPRQLPVPEETVEDVGVRKSAVGTFLVSNGSS